MSRFVLSIEAIEILDVVTQLKFLKIGIKHRRASTVSQNCQDVF